MKIRVAVLFGGKSVEHEVSIISGIQAIANMNQDTYQIIPVYIAKNNQMYVGDHVGEIEAYQNTDQLLAESSRVILTGEAGKFFLTGYPQKRFGKNIHIEIDVAFPVVHGTNVEDGTLQGYFKTIGIPFTGCDVTASAVGMDKYVTKLVLKEQGIPVLPGCRFTASDYKKPETITSVIEEKIGYPVILKPVDLGSSVGISVARNREELKASIDNAFQYANHILAEHAITKLREINCSVLGDDTQAVASVCEEPLHTEDILSYEDKYLSGGGKNGSKGMASVQRQIPAKLTPEMERQVKETAVKAFQSLGCSGVARIDFMIDEEDGKLYFNEINTIPGSLSFYLWEPAGVSYGELLDRLIRLAVKRQREQQTLTYTFATNILNQSSLGGLKGAKGGK